MDTRLLAYEESPFERIVDVHWKTDNGGGEPPPHPCEGPCGSGWMPTGHIYLGDIRGPGDIVAESAGAVWNPTSCCPATPVGFNPDDGSYDQRYFIPGNCASHLKITLKWADLVPEANNFTMGIWIFKNRSPYPPYRDLSDATAPPPVNPPPNNPDLSQHMGGSSDGEFLIFDEDAWFENSVIVVPAAGTSSSRRIVTRSGEVDPRTMIEPRDAALPYYGGAGSAPPFGGTWLDFDFTCQADASFLTPLTIPMRPRSPPRRLR